MTKIVLINNCFNHWSTCIYQRLVTKISKFNSKIKFLYFCLIIFMKYYLIYALVIPTNSKAFVIDYFVYLQVKKYCQILKNIFPFFTISVNILIKLLIKNKSQILFTKLNIWYPKISNFLCFLFFWVYIRM